MRHVLLMGAGLLAMTAFAFTDIPRASADALGVTKNSKPIESGVVFVNGKYLPPPYTVSRWGTGLRVNGRKVSGPIIAWDEFLKTQSGVRVEKAAPAPAAPEPVELAPEPGSDDDTSLDDLFDDDASKKSKAKGRKPARRPAARKAPAATYSLDGSFVANDASKALVGRINAVRSEIDRTLRLGGFVLFGDGYSRISGDARTADHLLETLPELMQKSESPTAFAAAVREKNLLFLNERACNDLYRNRIDYRQLREHAERTKLDRELKRTLKLTE